MRGADAVRQYAAARREFHIQGRSRWVASLVALALVALGLAVVPASLPRLSFGSTVDTQAVEPAWPAGLKEVAATVIANDAYRAVPDGAGWSATHPTQNLSARFTPAGLDLAGTNLSLSGIGRGDHLVLADEPDLVANENRIEFRRGPVVEWYENGPHGIEQGFRLEAPPALDAAGPLVVSMATTGPLSPRLAEDGASISFANAGGGTELSYSALHVYDSAGTELASRMDVQGTTIRLVADDARASYPLLIGPLIASEQAKLLPAGFSSNDQFGLVDCRLGRHRHRGGVIDDQYQWGGPRGGGPRLCAGRRELVAPDQVADLRRHRW